MSILLDFICSQLGIILLENLVYEINIYLKPKPRDPLFIPLSYPGYISSTQRVPLVIAVNKSKAKLTVKQNQLGD